VEGRSERGPIEETIEPAPLSGPEIGSQPAPESPQNEMPPEIQPDSQAAKPEPIAPTPLTPERPSLTRIPEVTSEEQINVLQGLVEKITGSNATDHA